LDEEEEGLDEISTSNILSGKRTRGKQINFAAAAGEFLDDDEEDEDFETAADAEDEEMHD
jgi:histone chaperone CHZ-like protein